MSDYPRASRYHPLMTPHVIPLKEALHDTWYVWVRDISKYWSVPIVRNYGEWPCYFRVDDYGVYGIATSVSGETTEKYMCRKTLDGYKVYFEPGAPFKYHQEKEEDVLILPAPPFAHFDVVFDNDYEYVEEPLFNDYDLTTTIQRHLYPNLRTRYYAHLQPAQEIETGCRASAFKHHREGRGFWGDKYPIFGPVEDYQGVWMDEGLKSVTSGDHPWKWIVHK